jgi:hypothetical protein
VVVLLQVLFELLEDEGLLVFLDVELELALFLLKGLFLVVTVLRLEGQLFALGEYLLHRLEIVVEVFLHRVGKKTLEFLLVGHYTDVEIFNGRCGLGVGRFVFVLSGSRP